MKRTRILAHGRSGTTYMAQVLQMAGMDIGHEVDRPHGTVGAILLKDKHDAPLQSYGLILHQVRDPLRVISSTTTAKMQNLEETWNRIGVTIQPRNELHAAMASWLAYNQWAEERATYRYQIERIDSVWPELCSLIGLRRQPPPWAARDTNSRQHKEYLWDELVEEDESLATQIWLKAQKYGYS